MIDVSTPQEIFWTKFSDYWKHCDKKAPKGACYGFVFSETKPKFYQQPSEFEECVYIGESAGWYYDGGKKFRSHVHKRMTNHHKPLTTGLKTCSSHDAIIEKYGFGDNILDGNITGLPLWLGLIIPREDLPDNSVKSWVQMHERQQIFNYIMKHGVSPLGNRDCDTNRDEDSKSTKRINNFTTLEEFLGD